MARRSTTKSADNVVVATEESVATININADENITTKDKAIVEEPLMDSDEIEVISLIPNVSYKDSKTNDFYEWDETGHVEYMTVETIKNMWRNNKSYFRNMCLKLNDERLIKKFGLTSTYEKFELLIDESNYTRKNVAEICELLKSAPNGLKLSILNKIKNSVKSGDISDVVVIRDIEKHFGLDLISFL